VQRGLFSKVIYHSGSALMPIFLEEDPRKHAQEIAKKADCQMVTVRDLNTCLMELTALELLTAFMEHAVSSR